MADPPQAHNADADNDSGVGSDTQSITTAITDSYREVRTENGRTYHSYHEGKYLLPNDDEEQNCLDLQNHLFNLTFGKLFTCPIERKQIRRVLDAGTGTGVWATGFADEYPEATVVGVDLSPIQPTWVPPNVKFLVDDLEEPVRNPYVFSI